MPEPAEFEFPDRQLVGRKKIDINKTVKFVPAKTAKGEKRALFVLETNPRLAHAVAIAAQERVLGIAITHVFVADSYQNRTSQHITDSIVQCAVDYDPEKLVPLNGASVDVSDVDESRHVVFQIRESFPVPKKIKEAPQAQPTGDVSATAAVASLYGLETARYVESAPQMGASIPLYRNPAYKTFSLNTVLQESKVPSIGVGASDAKAIGRHASAKLVGGNFTGLTPGQSVRITALASSGYGTQGSKFRNGSAHVREFFNVDSSGVDRRLLKSICFEGVFDIEERPVLCTNCGKCSALGVRVTRSTDLSVVDIRSQFVAPQKRLRIAVEYVNDFYSLS
jgi:hypothetical protein